jgi:hypothetical protein
MASWLAVGRHVGMASLAGLISGVVVGGALGRIAMRISGFTAGPTLAGVTTENGNRVGDITMAGSLAVVVFVGLGSGVLGGMIYAIAEPWLRRVRPWHGVAFGAALLLGFGFTVLDPDNFDFIRFGIPLLNVAMFAGLFVIFGVAIAWLFDALGAVRDGTGAMARAVDIAAWLALVPAVAAVVLFVGGAAGLDPLVAIAVVAAFTVPAIVRWRAFPGAIGYGILGAGVLLGAARTLSGLPSLLRGL